MQPILEIVETCIWSGRLENEKPVSLILIAEQESAKTEVLKHFAKTETIRYASDITSRGMIAYKNDIMSGKLRHICIMDLVRVANHGRGVSNRTFQVLGSLMEEGEADNSDAGGLEKWENFPKIGVVSAITEKYYTSSRGEWRRTGFLTRFLPVRFGYSESTVHEVHTAIATGHKLPEPIKLALPEKPLKVILKDKEAADIQRRAEILGQLNEVYGFRYHRNLRTLAKARALMHKRFAVTEQDVAWVLRVSDFFTEKVQML